jgi:hypothetical protein
MRKDAWTEMTNRGAADTVIGEQAWWHRKIVGNTEQEHMTVDFIQSHKSRGAIDEAEERTGAGSPQARISPLFISYLGYFVNLFVHCG